MTEHEILQKIDLCKTSNAPIEQKQAAIDELLAKLVPVDTLAQQQRIEGLADTSDMCNSTEE